MSRNYTNTGATVYCEDDHDPKIVQADQGVGACPECGAEYRIDVEVTPLDN